MKKTTLTIAMLLTGMAAVTAQAGDIKPLHHTCYAGNAINWPKPTGAGSPTGTGTSLNVNHGGSGNLAAGNTSNTVTFTCPAAQNGSFEINVRDKGTNTTTNVRATHVGTALVSEDVTGANGTFNQNVGPATKNGAGPYAVKVTKFGGTAALRYELCVQCYSGANETGTTAQPLSATVVSP